MVNHIKTLPKRLYDWTAKLAESKHAERSLYLITAAEAIFFPIPPDPFLMSMIFHKNSHWKRLTAFSIIASILGGVVGYIIGWAFFESAGVWLLDALHIKDGFDNLKIKFQDNATTAVLAAALTPIPYKLVTLTAGFSGINFFTFLIASIFGRGLRFSLVGYLAHHLGKRHKDKIEHYLNIITAGVLAIVVLAIWLLK